MNGWGEQRGHCSACGRVLRTGLELESHKQGIKCHRVQMGYRVSSGINGAQRAAREVILPGPGSWEVWFPEQRPKVPPDLWWCDNGLGEGATCLRERDRRVQTPRRAGLAECGSRWVRRSSKPLERIAPSNPPSLPHKAGTITWPLLQMRKLRQRKL